MERSDVEAWVDRYRRGRERQEEIAVVPAAAEEPLPCDAVVGCDRHRQPRRRRDERGETEFRYNVIAVDGDLGVVRGWTSYRTTPQRRYHNLWLVTLDDGGRCRSFVEWWVDQPH
jgi:hypothetical protein